MPDSCVTRAWLACGALLCLFAIAACGGGGSSGSAPAAEPEQIIDVATIGKSEAETWSLLADRWAGTALDEANTAGELLNDPAALRRLLAGKAPKLRDRIVAALDALGPRCTALETEVPPAPAELAAAATSLEKSCNRFGLARTDLTDALDTGDREILDRGLRRLAGGVNAIATAKEAIAPDLS